MPAFRIRALVALFCLALAGARSAQAAPPLEAYGRLPHVEFMSLSSSGRRYAFVSVTNDAQRLLIVPIDGGKPIAVPFDVKNKIRNVKWAGDDHVLVTISNTTSTIGVFTTDSIEANKVVVVSAATGSHFTVFDGQSAMLPLVMGEHGSAKVDGHWYGYFSALSFVPELDGTRLRRGGPDLYRVDLDSGLTTPVAKGGVNIDIGWLVGPDGKVIAQTDYFEKTGAWQIDNPANGRTMLSGHSMTGAPVVFGLGRTADTILAYVREGSNPAVELAALDGGPAQIVEEGVRMNRALYDDSTHLWIGETLEGDVPETVLFAPDRQARFNGVRKAFANYNVDLVSWNDDFNLLIVRTTGGDDSGTYWLADIAKHSVESVGQAYPDVKETDVGVVSVVSWKAADGLEIHGVLTLPPGRPAHGLPIVVLPHGGPQARDYPSFDWWAQAFASRGYAVLQPNFRGSDGYGERFVAAGHGEWGRKMQSDVSDGLAALAGRGVVDPKRACIVGASYGGYAALAGVTLQHGLYRCAVADAGVSDLRQMLKYEDARSGYDAASVSLRYWKEFMGASTASDDGLDAISPAKLAANADAPILLIHGKDDTVVPFDQSAEMQAALKRAGKPVEMVVMPNEDHWLSRPETRLAMLTAAVAFVQKYNPAD